MKLLVAGIGNIFLSDDGFGSEVARRLAWSDAMPPGVEVADFGIRGVHLAYQLLDGYDALVLIDAISTGEVPGTVSIFEPDIAGEACGPAIDAHGMDPASVLGSLAGLGGSVDRVMIVGCEPASIEEGIGLTELVAAALPAAVAAVIETVCDIIESSPEAPVPPAASAQALR